MTVRRERHEKTRKERKTFAKNKQLKSTILPSPLGSAREPSRTKVEKENIFNNKICSLSPGRMYTHSHARTRTHALTPNLLSPPSDGCGHHLGQRDRDPLSMSYHVLIFPSPCLHVFPQPAPKAAEGMSASHQRRTGWLRQKLAEDATAAEENGRKQNIERKEEEGPDAGRKIFWLNQVKTDDVRKFSRCKKIGRKLLLHSLPLNS